MSASLGRPHASHSFSPPIFMTSLLGLFKVPGSSAGRDVSLCSLQREFPPILPLQTHCLCSQPFFPSFSIVSCSLCSSLSNNRLFIFTLMRVLLCFFPHMFFYKCTIISSCPVLAFCVRVCRNSEGENGAFISNFALVLVSRESFRLKRTVIFLPL